MRVSRWAVAARAAGIDLLVRLRGVAALLAALRPQSTRWRLAGATIS